MTPVQHELFDQSTVGPTPCPVPGCGAIRTTGQDKVPTCAVDRSRALEGYSTSRPAGCLNTYKPEHAEIPY